jgi:hypothetical protein
MSLKIITVAMLSVVFAQDMKAQSLVELAVTVNGWQTDSELSVFIGCKNKGESNLILYGLTSFIMQSMVTEERLCDIEKADGAGIGLMIFNHKHERQYPVEKYDGVGDVPKTPEELAELLAEGRNKYLEGTRVVKAEGEISIERILNLKDFQLGRGTYQLRLIYFTGEGVWSNRIGADRIREDMESFNAKLFQGCAVSNFVEFTVD